MLQFSRTLLLIGEEGLAKLARSKVAVFGVGGVGSFTVEALARSGVGRIVLVDYDDICITNINRQIQALHSTIGRDKVDVLRERVLDINPRALVTIYKEFVTPENAGLFITEDTSYLVDAIDNVTGKLAIIEKAFQMNIPVISAMGAGNKLDPAQLKISDISATSVCPLARVMRRELKKRGIARGLKVVYSTEKPMTPGEAAHNCKTGCVCPGGDAHCALRRQIPGSNAFVPPVAGLLLASQVIRDILDIDNSC